MFPSSSAERTLDARPTILIVDDDEGVRDVVSQVLTDEGYRVRQATDGLAALAAVDADSVQLVLSDVQMPRLGGLALARLLLAGVHPVPVVLMGAVAPRARPPAVPYIPKPFALEHLLRTVADVLGRSRARRGTGRRGETAHSRVGG